MDILKDLLSGLDFWQVGGIIVATLLGLVSFKFSKLKDILVVIADAVEDDKITAEEAQKIAKAVLKLFKK